MPKNDSSARDVLVRVPRVVVGSLHCLFFGKRARLLTLPFKGHGHPCGTSYPIEQFDCADLDSELEDVKAELGVVSLRNTVHKLPCGVYTHVYGPKTTKCSGFRLSDAGQFFEFDASPPLQLCQRRASVIDVNPFIFAGEDLERHGSRGIYPWVTQPQVAWDWTEATWTERLLQCIKQSPSASGINVIPAFKWSSTGYRSELSTIFPNVMDFCVAPFHGMTDLLLIGEGSIAAIQIQDATSLICTVEVGLDKGPTHPITVACSLRRWPEKVGELLASTFAFGTLNYCNRLRATPPPEEVRWKAYGLLAIRSTGCLLLEMQLNKEGCHVKLLHEGGVFSLAEALDYVITSIKNC